MASLLYRNVPQGVRVTVFMELSNVKVYAGSPWNDARKGFIRNLEIDIKVPCIVAGETLF